MIRYALAALAAAILALFALSARAGADAPTEDQVLAAMLSLPQYVADRDDNPDKRIELYRPTAKVIAAVSKDRTGAAALVSLAWHETRLARYVLEGRCKDGPKGQRCDDGRARGPFQVWSWCVDAWKHPEGSVESIRAEARCAARMLAGAKRRCAGAHPAGDWAGAYSGYGGLVCTRPRAAARAKSMARIEAQLR